jgi:uncharacterized protein
MKKVFLLLFLLPVAVSPCFSQKHDTTTITIGDLPPAPAHHSSAKSASNTNDFEKLFTRKQIKQIDSIIYAFEKNTPFKIAVVTLDTSFTTGENFNDFAIGLATGWNIDAKHNDYRILIAISKSFHKMRICTFKGTVKYLSNEEVEKITYDYFIPAFKSGDYFRGTIYGLTNLIRILKEKYK